MFDVYHFMNIVLGILIFLIMIFIIKKQGLLEKYIDALPDVNGANKCSGPHSRDSSASTHYHGMCPCPSGHESDGSTGCKLCSAGTAGTGGTCDSCPDGHKPNNTKTDCEKCPRGTAGTGGSCNKCLDRTYASNTGRSSCKSVSRNVNVTPDTCMIMNIDMDNGGNVEEKTNNPYSENSVGDWGSCCEHKDCANDKFCVSFDNLPKRCLNDGMMKGWCGSQPDYKGDKYWDNTNKTWRCYTKDCDERNDENCTTLRDINNNPEVRCKYNTCSNGRCRDCVNK